MSKLREQDVLDIREFLSQGLTQRRIAAMYGILRQTISDIKRNKRWNWLK